MTKSAEVSLAAMLVKHFDALQNLCGDLEAIADSLPASINVQASLGVAQNIMAIVKSAHEFEERKIYPALHLLEQPDGTMNESIERLRFEHWADEEYAQEIYLALRDFVLNQNKVKAEALSWMLRGFFEGMRRHIAFERVVILSAVVKSEKVV